MDPITAIALAASLAQLIDVATKVLGYLNDVRTASDARSLLSLEMVTILTMLVRLRLRVEDARSPNQVWFSSLRALVAPCNGVLSQLESACVELSDKLKPSSNLGTKLRWHFDKKDVALIQLKIKRAQDMISLALQDDAM